MGNLITRYQVNDQGMIVEEIDEVDADELKEKVSVQFLNKEVSFESEAHQP